MKAFDLVLADYLRGPKPHRLEIGAGLSVKPGWLATDLNAKVNASGAPIIALDVTKDFPIPSDSFDFIYAEHMIEHISFDDGQAMLEECYRILRPRGVIRIVTPSLGFLLRVISPDRGGLEERYREWSVKRFAPMVTNAFFLNHFVRAWGHTFIYDHETLQLAMELAGFQHITVHELNFSDHPALCGLENEQRMPPGFLKLESMVLEGTKIPFPSTSPKNSGTSLALGKQATQSSISEWSREVTPERDAARVISGNLSGSYNCHTALEERPWWRVDLGRLCRIELIRIYNRTAQRAIMRRTNRFEIQISDDDEVWKTVFRKDDGRLVGGARYAPFIWVPEQAVQARFVRIQLISRQCLHLDQVEILGDEV
jgi:predicted SAM-dependent methyltransferase